MPIREVDAYGVTTSRPVSYVANRGANGIDGAISMTLGAVAASGEAGYALVGDVAALHDLTALRSAARFDLPLTTIVLHNDGGGIFHFLPMAEHVDPVTFETALGTPHGTRFAEVAAELGVPAVRVGRHGELLEALGDGDGPRLVEVTSDRTANHDAHRELLAAVAAAVA
jgi:2-succinyl-5-enolpyruvyl-6-hydroxy-3-cyclohexene-1-carboxylate synthase